MKSVFEPGQMCRMANQNGSVQHWSRFVFIEQKGDIAVVQHKSGKGPKLEVTVGDLCEMTTKCPLLTDLGNDLINYDGLDDDGVMALIVKCMDAMVALSNDLDEKQGVMLAAISNAEDAGDEFKVISSGRMSLLTTSDGPKPDLINVAAEDLLEQPAVQAITEMALVRAMHGLIGDDVAPSYQGDPDVN